MRIEEIDVTKIKDNPYQPRITIEKEPLRALTQSILQRGLINPISVLKDGENFIIISGHRRLRAFKNLKYKTIPCIVKDRQNNNELIIDLVHENLVREDLTPIEKGLSIKLLFSQIKGTKDDVDRICYIIQCLKNYENRGRQREFKQRIITGFEENDIFVAKKILREINITENSAVLYLQILKLPAYIQKELSFKKRGFNKDGKIAIAQAEQLVRVDDSTYQKYLFERALKGTNAKRLQALINEYKKKLEYGEWTGYAKKIMTGMSKIKNQAEKIDEISDISKKLSAKLRSFSIDTLIQLEETLEKEEFIISATELKREIILLRDRLDEKLAKKGIYAVRKNIKPFEILVRPQSKGRNDMRFTFPMDIIRELNLPIGTKSKVKLQVIGVKNG
jgi:hypothetical protein